MTIPCDAYFFHSMSVDMRLMSRLTEERLQDIEKRFAHNTTVGRNALENADSVVRIHPGDVQDLIAEVRRLQEEVRSLRWFEPPDRDVHFDTRLNNSHFNRNADSFRCELLPSGRSLWRVPTPETFTASAPELNPLGEPWGPGEKGAYDTWKASGRSRRGR